MKKILHMTPPDVNNGVYRYIFNHMQYIDLQKYQFSFLTKNVEGLRKTKEFKRYNFRIHALCNVERDNPDGLRNEVVRILNEGYDAIHLHTSSWRGFMIEQVAMELKLPRVIVHSHSMGIDEADEKVRTERFLQHNIYKEKFSMEYATDVCACSIRAGDWLFGQQIPRQIIQILPNAIDVQRYHFQPQVREEKRRNMGIEDRIVIGNVGRYCYQKNQAFLLNAFFKARRWNKKLFLLLIGHGELMQELKEQAKKLEIERDVCFLGWRENIEDYLQIMDIFCLPSRFEGLGISAIEAQAAGLTCLLADVIPEEVILTDLVKFLPLDEEVWTENILWYAKHFSREYRDDEIVSRGYDIRTAACHLEEFYEKKVAEDNRGG